MSYGRQSVGAVFENAVERVRELFASAESWRRISALTVNVKLTLMSQCSGSHSGKMIHQTKILYEASD